MADQPGLNYPSGERPERSLVDTLKPYAMAIWAYRRIVVLALLAAVIVFMIFGGLAYLRQPVVTTVSLPFRPTFPTVAGGKYPSGIPFSPSDIVAGPVLAVVHKNNNLDQYTSVEGLAASLSVLQTGTAAEMLALEYRNKMAAPGITPVDLARLEDEYRQRSRALQVEYQLTMINTSGIPRTLAQKVLSDVLDTWAKQAVELRGAVSYPQELLTAAGLGVRNPGGLDMFQRLDLIRAKTRRLVQNIAQIEALPGGAVVRGGPENLSLPEIRTRLEDMLRYRIEPAYGEIRSAGLVTDAASTQRYLTEQLRLAQRDAREANSRKAALERAFQTYLSTGDTGIPSGSTPADQPGTNVGAPPQLTDSLLDRIMTLGRRAEDIAFRQDLTRRIQDESLSAVTFDREVEFYQSLISNIPSGGANPETVTASVNMFAQTVTESADQVGVLYARITEHNLNPSGQLFALMGSYFERTDRPLPLSKLLTYLAIILVIVFIVACAGVLIHFFANAGLKARRRAAAAGTTAS